MFNNALAYTRNKTIRTKKCMRDLKYSTDFGDLSSKMAFYSFHTISIHIYKAITYSANFTNKTTKCTRLRSILLGI